jgi:hypothetical protein
MEIDLSNNVRKDLQPKPGGRISSARISGEQSEGRPRKGWKTPCGEVLYPPVWLTGQRRAEHLRLVQRAYFVGYASGSCGRDDPVPAETRAAATQTEAASTVVDKAVLSSTVCGGGLDECGGRQAVSRPAKLQEYPICLAATTTWRRCRAAVTSPYRWVMGCFAARLIVALCSWIVRKHPESGRRSKELEEARAALRLGLGISSKRTVTNRLLAEKLISAKLRALDISSDEMDVALRTATKEWLEGSDEDLAVLRQEDSLASKEASWLSWLSWWRQPDRLADRVELLNESADGIVRARVSWRRLRSAAWATVGSGMAYQLANTDLDFDYQWVVPVVVLWAALHRAMVVWRTRWRRVVVLPP